MPFDDGGMKSTEEDYEGKKPNARGSIETELSMVHGNQLKKRTSSTQTPDTKVYSTPSDSDWGGPSKRYPNTP